MPSRQRRWAGAALPDGDREARAVLAPAHAACVSSRPSPPLQMPTPPPPVRPEGSLGLLALGYRGLDAWRDARGTEWVERLQAKRAQQAPEPQAKPKPSYEGTTLTIVSGLPRSGTSMAMQLLVAGGLDPFTDAVREADESNPRGYYEHERVKGSASDVSWIPDASGHVVKVVAPLLPYLPPGPEYRVVFMERELDEILESQSVMLTRDGRTAADAERLRMAYANMLQSAFSWAGGPAAPKLLRVAHKDAIATPQIVAQRMADFLDLPAERAEDMAAVVDPSLHRQRA